MEEPRHEVQLEATDHDDPGVRKGLTPAPSPALKGFRAKVLRPDKGVFPVIGHPKHSADQIKNTLKIISGDLTEPLVILSGCSWVRIPRKASCGASELLAVLFDTA